jgi:hypothetical protein
MVKVVLILDSVRTWRVVFMDLLMFSSEDTWGMLPVLMILFSSLITPMWTDSGQYGKIVTNTIKLTTTTLGDRTTLGTPLLQTTITYSLICLTSMIQDKQSPSSVYLMAVPQLLVM